MTQEQPPPAPVPRRLPPTHTEDVLNIIGRGDWHLMTHLSEQIKLQVEKTKQEFSQLLEQAKLSFNNDMDQLRTCTALCFYLLLTRFSVPLILPLSQDVERLDRTERNQSQRNSRHC